MPAWLLKALAALVTGLATAGSAAYVGGHLVNPAAPLHPPVVTSPASARLHLEPSVRSVTDQQPLTFTNVS